MLRGREIIMKNRFLFFLLGALLCAVCAVGVSAQTEIVYNEQFSNPVVNGADPFVYYEDGVYYLYATNDGSYGYVVYTSDNLVDWKAQGYALRKGDVELDASISYAGLWAPEVFKDGDTYYMVYTAQEHLGIATSDSPLGPFKDKSGRLFEEKAIDGHFFRDDDGRIYLYFVSCGAWSLNGGSVSTGNNIWGGEFDLETCTFVSGPKLLLQWDSGDWNVNEGPEMLKHNGTYYLTYSAQGYGSVTYSVRYATSDNPLGVFTKVTDATVLVTDDPNRSDPNNNLYGTAHHCFTQLADGTLMIVYHAHRSGTPSELLTDNTAKYVEERRICIDRAWFDDNGVLRAGDVNNVGHPTITAAVAPTGESAKRSVMVDDNFAALATLPTVYVSMYDGYDTNSGSKTSPFRTLDKAYAELPSGGTIVLLQKYDMQSSAAVSSGHATDSAYFVSPKVDGPIMIRGEFSAVPVLFKFWSIQSDTYLDNIVLMPRTTGGISVIECGQNNVVIGEGVSCSARPNAEQFPVLVGGYWCNASESASSPYKYYSPSVRPSSLLTTDKAYSLTVLGGTWSIATAGSVRSSIQLANTAPNATMTLGEGVFVRPAKMTGVSVKLSAAGAVLTYPEIKYALKYRVCDGDGNLVGYSDTTTFVDTSYVLGEPKSYTVAPYVNGACIGDASSAVTVTSYGDMNGDGEITLADALMLLQDILDGKVTDAGLANVVLQLKACIK